jgi:hypothetical protein
MPVPEKSHFLLGRTNENQAIIKPENSRYMVKKFIVRSTIFSDPFSLPVPTVPYTGTDSSDLNSYRHRITEATALVLLLLVNR